MNIPILMNTDELEKVRNELDVIIKRFQKMNEIGMIKQQKIDNLIGKENASKVIDILFEEIILE